MAYKQQIPLKFHLKQMGKKWKKYSKFFYILTSLFIIFGIGYVGLKLTFLSPQNKVKNIIFNPKNIQYFDEPSLYNTISSGLENKNIYSLKADSKSLIGKIQQTYPILKDIHFQNSGDNTYVNIDFFTPTLIFNHEGSYVGVYNGYFFPISNDSNFLSGRNGIILPRYVGDLTGSAFYEVSEQQLKYQMERIVSTFNPKKIIYLLGGNKTFAQLSNGQYLIFDNISRVSDINVQIEKYELFKSNPISIPEKDIKIIDLGSNYDSVIVSTGNYFGSGLDFDDFDTKQSFSGDALVQTGENISSESQEKENFSSSKNSSSSKSQNTNGETA